VVKLAANVSLWAEKVNICETMHAARIQLAANGRREIAYTPVLVDSLRCLDSAPVDIFVDKQVDSSPMLYCRAGFPIATTRLLGLSDAGIEHVYIRADDYRTFGAELLDSVKAILQRDEFPTAAKFAALQAAVSVEIEHSARLVDCRRFLQLADRVGRDLVSLLAGNDVLPRDLFGLARHDFHTFTHVTNVASYSIILAERLGVKTGDELNQIAVAAILHDIGKRLIPISILTKPARLDPAERKIIELHPVRGYEELQHRAELTFGQLMVVYQHHEKVDGTGYPVRVKGGDIHPWAKLLAVVDVFDAMTGNRPYRRPATPQFALEYIRENSGTHFDPEIAKCWISAMSET
jgi:HD-GYP domain-containing protein (c-di-GMP phosphodiesterase class II)